DATLTRFTQDLTPTPGANDYRIQLPQDSANIDIYAARLLVRQAGATKTHVYISLLDGEDAAFADDHEVALVNSTTYTELGRIVRKDESAYRDLSGTTPWTLEVMLASGQKSRTAYAALFNRATNAMVAGSQVSTSSTAWQVVSAALSNTAANFTNLN